MSDLKFPIIKETYLSKYLSMDDYLIFVTLLWKYTLDKDNIRKQKKAAAVNVPFSLR